MKNDWEKRFGARRREIDRQLLADAEMAIIEEELQPPREDLLTDPKVKIGAQVKEDYWRTSDELRENIARMFGRPPK